MMMLKRWLSYKGEDLDDVLNDIATYIVLNGYVDNDHVVIILSSTGNVDNEQVKNNLNHIFAEKEVNSEVIVIDNITKEDMKYAEENNMGYGKAAYINSLVDSNSNVSKESLSSKPINELKEMKETGKYCEDGYTLEGDLCLKEIYTEKAIQDYVCPVEYYEYDGICYKEVGAIETDELECFDSEHFTLIDNKCVGKEIVDAKANFKCEVGTLIQRREIRVPEIREQGDESEYLCEDTSTATYPEERCYLQEHAIIDGKCAMGPKPLLPTPTGCEGHDINYNGGCYDPYPDEPYVCPNGLRYDTNDNLCPDTFTYSKATGSYSCEKGYELVGDRCEKEVSEDARHKMTCPSGYTMLETGRCVNESDTVSYVYGYRCLKNDARVENDTCIIYDIKDAKIN